MDVLLNGPIRVGSAGLEYVLGTSSRKLSKPLDIDLWFPSEEVKNQWFDTYDYLLPVEFTVIPAGLYKLLVRRGYYDRRGGEYYLTLDAYYTIKCSHLQWDIKWDKTKRHILEMGSLGAKLIPYLYSVLVKHWEQVHGAKDYLNLNKTKEEFFLTEQPFALHKDKYIGYKYDHDWLHEMVAFPDKPVYTLCLKENEDVMMDVSKFGLLPYNKQIRMFQEEIAVIAFERFIATGVILSINKAWSMSLKKTITTLTKGWASTFIIRHLHEFVKPDFKLFTNLFKQTKEGNLIMSTNKEAVEKLKALLTECGVEEELTDSFVVNLADNDDVPSELAPYYEHVYTEGGGEGGSEYVEGVFKLKDTFFMTDWRYFSHNGYDYDDALESLRIVTPSEKTITVYN